MPRECRKRQRDREMQAMLQKGNLARDATGNEGRVSVLGDTCTKRPRESPGLGREAPGRTGARLSARSRAEGRVEAPLAEPHVTPIATQ